MKRFIVLLTFISVIAVLSACSSQPSLELTNKKVEITNSKSSMILQEGEKEGTEVVPKSLSYAFSIKNVGKKKIGDIAEPLIVKIEPNEKLVTAFEEVMGFNLFDSEGYKETGLGYGHSFDSIIEPNAEGEFSLHYDLGVDVETNEALFVPSTEGLEMLKDNAFEATIIVLVGDKAIARFDLSEKE